MEDHGPNFEKKWSESMNVMHVCDNTQGKYDKSLEIFESFHVKSSMHFLLRLKP